MNKTNVAKSDDTAVLPTQLRRTLEAVKRIGDGCNSNQVAGRTGNARAVESLHLNQLEDLGLLKKDRRGRTVFFSWSGKNVVKKPELSIIKLLEMPDYLREIVVAVAICGPCTSEDIALERGREKATTSSHLNQLVRASYLEKKTEGKRVFFSVTREVLDLLHQDGPSGPGPYAIYDIFKLIEIPYSRRRAYMAVERGGAQSAEDVGNKLGIKRAVASKYLNELVRSGYLESTRNGRKVSFRRRDPEGEQSSPAS